MLSNLPQSSGSIDFFNNLDKRVQGTVTETNHCLTWLGFPNQEESITNILVWCPSRFHSSMMHNATNFINEKHNIFLQTFGGICETSNITKTINGINLLARNHDIEVTTGSHVMSNNFCPCFTETNLQHTPNLDHGFCDHSCFTVILVSSRIKSSQGIVRQFSDNICHLHDWTDKQFFSIRLEQHRTSTKKHNNKQRHEESIFTFHSFFVPDIKPSLALRIRSKDP